MKRLFVATVLLAFSINGYAGNYYLTIADDLNSACALKAKKDVKRSCKACVAVFDNVKHERTELSLFHYKLFSVREIRSF